VIVGSLVPVQIAVFVLAAGGATAVALARDLLKMAILSGLYGWVLALLFFVLSAPDVALSMIVVSAIGYPAILLIAITRSRR
jgi:energy-converting hydrogenase B subunit D